LKKLSTEIQPYHEVVEKIIEATDKGAANIRIIEHILSYAEFQFGDRIPGKSYRERGNGDQISNWKVEIEIIIGTIFLLTSIYSNDALTLIIQDKKLLPYVEKQLDILKPWYALIDLDSTDTNSLNVDQVNKILNLSSSCENWMANISTNKRDYGRAESSCQKVLSCALRYEGDNKTGLVFNAYRTYSALRRMQNNYKDAITWAEEAYNCVAIAYNPVHPEVQTAAGTLIECLIHTNDLEKAETFAQLTLDSLRDPANGVDQNSEAVAKGYYSLAKVINAADGDYVKAEKLAREAYRIHVQLFGKDHHYVGFDASLLANVLVAQGKLTDEAKELFERYIAICIRNEGVDGINTAIGNNNLGKFHLGSGCKHLMDSKKRNEQLRIAKPYYTEVSIMHINTCTLNMNTVLISLNIRIV
jgi:tetratricopeptide (TPR) repeat protein